MNFFKRQYRVIVAARVNKNSTDLDIEYEPEVKRPFSFKWRTMTGESYSTEYRAWEIIEQVMKLPKPITYEEYKKSR
jgi:hypothetical protein